MRRIIMMAAAVCLAASAAKADDTKQIAKIPDSVVEKIRAWAETPAVLAAIKAQNAETAGYSQEQIDKLDKTWRAEVKTMDRPLVTKVLSRDVSAYLREVKAQAQGLYLEIFVMDARGLNVGQSDVTSDYWQGDEAKFKKSFGAGPQAVFKDKVEFDESTQMYQAQISLTISEDGKPIGAVTVGLNVEELD